MSVLKVSHWTAQRSAKTEDPTGSSSRSFSTKSQGEEHFLAAGQLVGNTRLLKIFHHHDLDFAIFCFITFDVTKLLCCIFG